MGKGDVLVTIATGNISEREADRAGLVQTHACKLIINRRAEVSKCYCLKQLFTWL